MLDDSVDPRTKSGLVDVMLRTRLNTALLQPQDGLIGSFAGEERVCTEAFPVAPALCYTSHVHHRSKGNVDALSFMFHAHVKTAEADELAVEPGTIFWVWRALGRTVETYVAPALIPVGKAVM